MTSAACTIVSVGNSVLCAMTLFRGLIFFVHEGSSLQDTGFVGSRIEN